jgi:hypothetical protein
LRIYICPLIDSNYASELAKVSEEVPTLTHPTDGTIKRNTTPQYPPHAATSLEATPSITFLIGCISFHAYRPNRAKGGKTIGCHNRAARTLERADPCET